MTQYFQGFGRRTTAAARTTFTPPESPFADTAARDTWAAANLNLLFNNVMQYTLIEVTGIGSEQWGGEDTPTVYNNSGWVLSASEMLTATQIKALYESNPNTNALEDDKNSVLDSLSINTENQRIISDRSIEVPPGTIYVGNATAFGSSVRSLHVRSDVTGNRALLIAQLYDDTDGFARAFTYAGPAPTTFVANDPAGTDISDTANFPLTASFDELITTFRIFTNRAEGEVVPFTIEIRVGSADGAIAYQFEGDVTMGAGGVGELDISQEDTPILVDQGTVLYFSVTCQGMIGNQVTPEIFVPNSEGDRIILTRRPIVTHEELLNGTHNGINIVFNETTGYYDFTTVPATQFQHPAITSFGIQGQDLLVDADTTISGTLTFTYAVSNTGNVQGDLVINQDDTLINNTVSATGSSVDIAVNSVTLAAGQSTTFELEGQDTMSQMFSREVTIRARVPAEILYYGVSDTITPADIDLSSLTTADVVSGTSFNADFVIPNTQYAVILSPADREITSITDRTFNLPALDQFVKTDDARTINGQSYDLYTHQNNAGVQGTLATTVEVS